MSETDKSEEQLKAEIDSGAREILEQIQREHDVDLSETSEELVITTLFEHIEEYGSEEAVENYHSSIVDGEYGKFDIGFIMGTISGGEETPDDIWNLTNASIEAAYEEAQRND